MRPEISKKVFSMMSVSSPSDEPANWICSFNEPEVSRELSSIFGASLVTLATFARLKPEVSKKVFLSFCFFPCC